MFASPSGCPSFANAAPEMKMGMDVPKPRIVGEVGVRDGSQHSRMEEESEESREVGASVFLTG